MTATMTETRSNPGLPKLDGRNRYSLMRAIRSQLGGLKLDGIELEVHQELGRRRSTKPKGVLVPWDAPLPERRALTTTTGSGSIQTTHPRGMLIDALRPKLAVARLGGMIANITEADARGNIQIPVKSAVTPVSWVAEGSAPSQSNLTVGSVSLTPKTCTAFTDLTRRMITESDPGFEEFVIDDIAASIAVAVDGAALNGPGSSNQPLGLLQTSGLPSIAIVNAGVNGGAITYADLVALEDKLGVNLGDSPLDARVGLLTSVGGRAALRKLDLGGATPSGRFAWNAKPMVIDGVLRTVESVLGYPAVSTSLVPENLTLGTSNNVTAACLGNFTDLLVNLFSGFDMIVNPYLQSTGGIVRITGLQDVDVAVRRAGSFVLAAGWLAG
jgi:HK97 family phage major capsid protein